MPVGDRQNDKWSLRRTNSLVQRAIAFHGFREGHTALALVGERVQLALYEWLAEPFLGPVFQRLGA